jgi:hypothetical protein
VEQSQEARLERALVKAVGLLSRSVADRVFGG